ncbi:hypothetical protein [Trinickia diaoshuihuensis]|uniref:hypothetical protein n=1 Tax=Trinickia diaoshuihuensis TaxID=2292265 RepID=UPI0013C2A21B|nr:hypothetical protein [Trinickia diaoshuihuensis]
MSVRLGRVNRELRGAEIARALNDGINVRVAPGNTWTFPSRGADGVVGPLCVSRLRRHPVAGANQNLAVHVTFGISQIFVGTERHPSVRVEFTNLHFTARPVNLQVAIAQDNLIARLPNGRSVSLHRSVNDWEITDVAAADLANVLGIATAGAATTAIRAALAQYTAAAWTTLRDQLALSLVAEINDNLEPREYRGRPGTITAPYK